MVRTYRILDYDAVFLSPGEHEWFAKNQVDVPKDWVVAENAPRTKIITVGKRKVGLVFLPVVDGNKPQDYVPAIEDVRNAATGIRPDVDLLVGVSPWLIQYEMQLLSFPEPMFDILLGGGPGVCTAGRIESKGCTFWIRPYEKGRVVHQVVLKQWPKNSGNWCWKRGVNIDSWYVALSDSVQADPQIQGLLN